MLPEKLICGGNPKTLTLKPCLDFTRPKQDNIGIMEKKMKTTIVYWGIYGDNGTENGNYYHGLYLVIYKPCAEIVRDNSTEELDRKIAEQVVRLGSPEFCVCLTRGDEGSLAQASHMDCCLVPSASSLRGLSYAYSSSSPSLKSSYSDLQLACCKPEVQINAS